ncbi:MAG: acyl carrier protein [Ginsengibacter sp.]
MTLEEIKLKIREYIVENAYVEHDEVMNDTQIFVEGLLDSMGFILLISFIEETFQFKAKDSELLEENFQSVNAISTFVVRKLQENLNKCAE